jgi:hypothetical protein
VRDNPFLEVDFPLRDRLLRAFGFRRGEAQAAHALGSFIFFEQVNLVFLHRGGDRLGLRIVCRHGQSSQKLA